MSVLNGYKDVLVRKAGDVFKVDGLSPAGHAWVNETIVGPVYPEYIGRYIGRTASAGLSVEVR